MKGCVQGKEKLKFKENEKKIWNGKIYKIMSFP